MSTIKSSKEIDGVFRHSKRAAHPLLIVLVAPTPLGRDQSGRVAFIAGKKLGPAVVRNRAKRLLRAAAKEAGAPWPGSDVLLVARPGSLGASSSELASTIKLLVRRLDLER